MPYITREDGERFVIPSYRDVLRTKSKSVLKREILLLSANYGEYITLQKKASDLYEAAFSVDPGYLLGESIWFYLKQPFDMIYCEAIPNTSEAILVIVKSGSVYLDGSFPVESIPEELVIFKTQENNFDIYIQGDVPISEIPEEGKFYFDASSVKNFTILDTPIFPLLPLYKNYHLQLVDTVLKSQGIGVLPIKQTIIALVSIGLLWMVWNFITTHKEEIPTTIIGPSSPYQAYITQLTSPDPVQILQDISKKVTLLLAIPGWLPEDMIYGAGTLTAQMRSFSVQTNILYDWAKKNNATVEITTDGFFVNFPITTPNRNPPTKIFRMQDIIARLVDRLLYVIPGNVMKVGTFVKLNAVTETELIIQFSIVPPITLDAIAQQFKDLPLILTNVHMKLQAQGLSGTITLKAFGN